MAHAKAQCDLFASVRLAGDMIAIAVEAKVNEPFGPTIGEWMQNPSKGKIERMKFICDRLGLRDQPPAHLRYQLFHRTASALIEADRFKTDRAAMIVQSFAQDHRRAASGRLVIARFANTQAAHRAGQLPSRGRAASKARRPTPRLPYEKG